MSNYVFRLPDIGEGVADAEIVKWHVEAGDRIEEDQLLVDVMTDKATVEIPSPVFGQICSLLHDVGHRVPVGSGLVEMTVDCAGGGPDASDTAMPNPDIPPSRTDTEPAGSAIGPGTATESREEPYAGFAATARALPETPLVLAAPAVRRLAYERGIPLQFVRGSGPGGRVTLADLDRYDPGGAPVGSTRTGGAAMAREGITRTKLIGLRRRIADKMQESKRNIPHFGYVEEFDMTALEELRVELNEERAPYQPKLTLLPFFMRAITLLVREFPQINARFDEANGVLHSFEGVHIGIATQTSAGLLVPVVKHVEGRDLWDCAAEMARVTTAARNSTATREELTGSTITLTSLGVLGGISATPVINHPEVAIIGPNKVAERPIVRNGQIVIRKMMNLSSSFDHRIVDGYDAARFIQRLRRLIEKPALIFAGQS